MLYVLAIYSLVWCIVFSYFKSVECIVAIIDNNPFVESEGHAGEESKQLFDKGKFPMTYYVVFT